MGCLEDDSGEWISILSTLASDTQFTLSSASCVKAYILPDFQFHFGGLDGSYCLMLRFIFIGRWSEFSLVRVCQLLILLTTFS